jgi:hypothetical protein
MATKVGDSVPFRPEQTEYLVLICKLVRGNPSYHLGSNIGSFRVILVNFGPNGNFGHYTFNLYFFICII